MEWTQRLRMRQLYLLVELHETRNVSRTATKMGVTMLQDGNLAAPMSARLMHYFHRLKQWVLLLLPNLREGSVG